MGKGDTGPGGRHRILSMSAQTLTDLKTIWATNLLIQNSFNYVCTLCQQQGHEGHEEDRYQRASPDAAC